MKDAIQTHIVDLHHFFQDWFNGKIPPSDDHFKRSLAILAPEFTMINPGGVLVRSGELLANLKKAYDSHQGLRIWIRNTFIQHQVGDLTIATYEEWQEIDGQVSARLSSAVFKSSQDTHLKFQWIHLHETWLEH